MKKLLIISILLAAFAVGAFAEPCDACTDQTIWYIIVSDTVKTGGVIDYPGTDGTDATSCCPDWSDTITHVFFPDTLALPGELADLWTSEGGWWGIDPLTSTNNWYTGDEAGMPPLYPNATYNGCCCVGGIYWKAKVWEADDGSWSAWTDVNSPGQGNTTIDLGPPSPILIALLNTGGVKLADLSGNINFTCNSDSVAMYVWDCENEAGAPTDSSTQEFGFSMRTFPDPASMGGNLTDTVWLAEHPINTGIEDRQPATPKQYSLGQNTPNPFNAKTVITYALPEDAEVEIEVTNLLGQKVATLVSEHQSAGYKRIAWDGVDQSGGELPSGVYFYSIRANDFRDKKRAILMK